LRTITRTAVTAAAAAAALLVAAPAALAHQCTNASKPPQAGAQIVFNAATGDISYVTPGLQKRIDSGQIDLDTGEGFHGIVGVDFDGDGRADFSTYIVGPESQIPLTAQFNGAECKGIVNVETLFSTCLAA
jgi:hypothetical protein